MCILGQTPGLPEELRQEADGLRRRQDLALEEQVRRRDRQDEAAWLPAADPGSVGRIFLADGIRPSQVTRPNALASHV